MKSLADALYILIDLCLKPMKRTNLRIIADGVIQYCTYSNYCYRSCEVERNNYGKNVGVLGRFKYGSERAEGIANPTE